MGKREYQNMIDEKKLKWAKDFLSYNIKEGVYDADFIAEMTDEQIITFAQHEMDLADYMVDSYMEEGEEDEKL